jgi:hypothetical protein
VTYSYGYKPILEENVHTTDIKLFPILQKKGLNLLMKGHPYNSISISIRDIYYDAVGYP